MKLNFKIHRGTREIGGSCVEIWTENSRILIDFGIPLVDSNGNDFNLSQYQNRSRQELVKIGVLPDIPGLYDGKGNMIDGVIISHAHQDHYGFINHIDKHVPFYLGKASHEIIKINNRFSSQNIHFENIRYFEKGKAFQVGDLTITPYWADHSAFDAYSFLIEAQGKSIFYSGDFRGHGRKEDVFKWFLHNAPQNVDVLLLEGTAISEDSKPFKKEKAVEEELFEVFRTRDKINLAYVSGQNIDRLVSIYRACKRANKLMVVDVYVATILKELSKFAALPHPSPGFANLRVMFPFYTSRKLSRQGDEKILYQFKEFKITKDEIGKQAGDIVMLVRPSMQKDLEHIEAIEGGNLIYSMWEGYLLKPHTRQFIDYLISRGFTMQTIHTSGHADTQTLKQMVEAMQPKTIVPIHTFGAGLYKSVFTSSVIELNDGEIMSV